MPDSISASKQDYLEAILDFATAEETVRSIDIARALKVSRASVNKSLGALKESGLIEHEHYGDIRLTEKGCASRGRCARGTTPSKPSSSTSSG
jgi:Mn-dependent DtxR family transcriptional regulator